MNSQDIQELLRNSNRQVNGTSCEFHRYLYNEIDWRDRLICVMGARGTGKSPMSRTAML